MSVAPDGIGSYASYDGDPPPAMMWADQAAEAAPEQQQTLALPAQSGPSPEEYQAMEQQVSARREAAAQMPLKVDLPPALADAIGPLNPGPTQYARLATGDIIPAGETGDRALLGAAFVLVGAGAAIGAAKAGLFGSIAGGLYGGAAVNAIRATRTAKVNRQEAVISGTFAIVGAGVATYLLWKSQQSKSGRASEDR